MPFKAYGELADLKSVIQTRRDDVRTIATLEQTVAQPRLPSYAKASLPSAAIAGFMIYVTDDVGGAVPAFSDGTNWRRVTDRNVIS